MVISITDNSTAVGLTVPQIYKKQAKQSFLNIMSPGIMEMFTPCFLAWLVINVREHLLSTVALCSVL